MKIKDLIRGVSLVMITLLTACGPSQNKLNVTATQIAARIYATQTAQAPTATMTYTPSPTATITPTSTPTPIPTNTPLPTSTPKPSLSSVILTLNDLPPDFVSMPESGLQDMKQQLPEGSEGFGFSDDSNYELIMGFVFPFESPADASTRNELLAQFVRMFPPMFGADQNVQDLSGLDTLGEARAGITSTGAVGDATLRWDMVMFLRGNFITLLIIGYPDGNKVSVSYNDVAQLIDERIIVNLTQSYLPSPFNADTIAGKWSGTIKDAENATVSQLNLDILSGCTMLNVCGTISEVDQACSGEIKLETISGRSYGFTEQNMAGSSNCVAGGQETMRLLSNGSLFWRYQYTSPSGETTIHKALLVRP